MVDEENLEQDKLKELIDSVEVSIPGEIWQELEKKRQIRLVLAILCTIGCFVLSNQMEDLEALWLIILPWSVAIHQYKQLFRSMIVAKVLGFVTGIKADNERYYKQDNELFGILATAGSAFNLNTNGMWFDRQFCVPTDGWDANYCNIFEEKTSENSGTREVYRYQMLKISKSDVEFEGRVLIVDKRHSKVIAKIARTGVIRPSEDLEEVKLISPEFNERFSVYADDQISVRKFLKPAFMEHFASTAAEEFQALHIEGNTISMLSDGGFEKIKPLVHPPNLLQGTGPKSAERICKNIKKGLVANLESHYKNVMKLRALVRV